MKKITFLLFLMLASITVSHGQVEAYTFTQSAATYTPITGGTVLGTATNDDTSFNALNIGFTFNYNGADFTQVSVSSNGFLAMGATVSSSYAAISGGTSNNVVAALNGDLQGNPTTGELSYLTIGTAPDRVFTVQWSNYRHYNIAGDNNSFQINLYETTNVVEVVYGSFTQNATTRTRQVGLRGSSSAVYNNRTTTTDWSATTAGGINSATCTLTTAIVPTSGLTFNWTPPDACTGTPSPGNTISSNSTICAGVNFNLSLQNQTTGSAVTYQWQTSPDGLAPWTDTTGTSSSFTTSQTAITYYQCVVTCTASATSTTSIPVMVGLSVGSSCYCTPIYVTGKTDGDLISNIVIAGTTLANNSGTAPVNPAYTYFVGLPNYTATLQAGSSYNISVTVGTFGNQNVAVWIDYNDDGFFDTTERVGFTTTSIGSNGTATFPISLACNPALGLHRMRVRDVYASTGNLINPCNSYGFGETEDYDITISTAVACPQPSTLGVNTITINSANLTWNTGCAETAWDLHLTTAGGGAPSGAPSNPGVTSPFAAASLSPATAYEFYVRADCAANGTSLWTGPFPFTTAALPPLNDECTGAYPVTVNPDFLCGSVTAGTVLAATASTTDAAACFGSEDDDVWFSFVATATTHQISLTNVVGSATDLFHSLWTGADCSSLSLVAGSCSDPNTSTPTGLTPGDTYYIRVYSYTATIGQTTSFNVCVGTFPPTPANDDCDGAFPVTVNPDLACGSVTAGSVASATASSVDDTICAGSEDDDVWFSFVATEITHQINLLNIVGSATFLNHSLWTGADCSSLTAVPNTCSNGNASTPTGLTVGDTYYIRVYTNTATPGQTTTFDVCVGIPPPPPANDECDNAIPITAGGVFGDYVTDATNVSATTSSQTAPTTCGGFSGGDVWFTVDVPASGNLTIETGDSTTGATGVDTVVTIYTGPDCNTLTQVGCDDDAGVGAYSLKSLTGLQPGTLYLRVYEYQNDNQGGFGISAYDGSLATTSFDSANFKYYPNPVKNMLNLSYTQTISSVAAYNLLGQEVVFKVINANQSQIDMSDLPTGAYLVKVIADNQVKTIKVFKE